MARPLKPLPPCPFPKRFPSQLDREDTFYMSHAYNQAIQAWEENEVPVGAVVVHAGKIVGSAHNQVESTGDPTAHAEILAFTQASRAIEDWRLNEAVLYVTKEPCPMCSGASVMARIGKVVYAVADPKMGCLGSARDLRQVPGFNHRFEVVPGVLEDECRELLKAFFQARRQDISGPTRE